MAKKRHSRISMSGFEIIQAIGHERAFSTDLVVQLKDGKGVGVILVLGVVSLQPIQSGQIHAAQLL